MPAAPSCDILGSLRASGPVKRLFDAAACQRSRQATFSRRCVSAEPSSDFFTPLRASGSVKRLFHAAACQRSRQATFSRRCVPAEPSSDLTARSHTLLRSADGSTEQHSRKQCGA